MLTVVPYHPGDAAQALAQACWISELDAGLPNEHDLLLIADTRCTADVTEQIRAEYAKSFRSVTVMPFVDHWRKWAASPNEVFSTAARHIAANQKTPWFFCEPDSVPLVRGWRDAIWAEYLAARKAGKYFLGDLITADNSGVKVETHMSGNAVYPANLYDHCGNVFLAGDLAFDVAGAAQIVPQMQTSELIRHSWNAPAFANWEDVQARIFAVKPKACLFHADKRISLIPLLREHMKGGDAKCSDIALSAAEPTRSTARVQPSNAAPTFEPERAAVVCDLLLKTFPADYPFAEYCVRSIDKFCSGFRKLIIVTPQSTGCPSPTSLPYTVVIESEVANGYNGQQLVKMNADKYSDATHFLFCDSDTIFTKPVTPETYMRDGKPLWLMTPFEKAREDQKQAWIPVMTKWMGKAPEFEFMRRHFFMFPRWLCEEIKKFCQEKHGMSLEDYVMKAGPGLSFSEFNCGGFLAYEKFRDRFAWVNTETDEVPELTALQHWSRGGLTPDIVAEFETILSGSVDGHTSEEKGMTRSATSPEQVASENQSSSAQAAQLADDIFRLFARPLHRMAARMEAGQTKGITEECEAVTMEHVLSLISKHETILSGGISTAVSARPAAVELTQERVEQLAEPLESAPASPAQAFSTAVPTKPAYIDATYNVPTPWEDRNASIAEINRLAARLKEFQGDNAAKVRFVRELLQRQGVIELPYRNRKRKGWKRKKK